MPGYQDDVALLASLQLAQMRWGVIKVTGTDEFKDRVVQLAAEFDLRLSNEDLALRVHQRRSSPGTLSAPTEQEIAAASSGRSLRASRQPEPSPKPTPLATAAAVTVAQEDSRATSSRRAVLLRQQRLLTVKRGPKTCLRQGIRLER